MNDWDFNRMVQHYLYVKKKELKEQCMYLRWTSLLPSPAGAFWHVTLDNPMTHKYAHWDLRPFVIKDEERDGLNYKEYIDWCIKLMTSQVL